MWLRLATFILRYKFILLLLIAVCTVFWAWQATGVQMEHNLPKIIPQEEKIIQDFQFFKNQFGDDANTLVVGYQNSNIFDKDIINDWYETGETIKAIEGVTAVTSVANAVYLSKNKEAKRFELSPLMSKPCNNQMEADSLRTLYQQWKFYDNRLLNDSTGATILAVGIDADILNSERRIEKVKEILEATEAFSKKYQVELHYSGMPFLRNYRITTMADEVRLFLMLSFLIVAFILFVLFRSVSSVLLPMLVVAIGVIWAVGMIAFFGYKIDLLLGIVPTLIVIIGIPNCVYLINKYHLEYLKFGKKQRALAKAIERIGNVVFYANITTAIGFGVFSITKSEMLQRFGVIAGINILTVFVISIIVLPGILSYLSPPKRSSTVHLESALFKRIIQGLKQVNVKHQKLVWLFSVLIIVAAVFGLLRLKSQGYIFDDLPKKTKAYNDLLFFQNNFTGVVPFELVIDTKKKGRVVKGSTLKIIDKIQKGIAADPEITQALSIAEGVKMATQAYYGGKASRYQLPNSMERNLVFSYLSKMERGENSSLLDAFMDKEQRYARINFQMKDVGSMAFNQKMDRIEKMVNEAIGDKDFEVIYTGSSMVALKGYQFLVDGLVNSLLVAFALIALIMAFLFRSLRMLLIAFIPNIIPLLITAAIMGAFQIHLKPATVLIFSIAFGISVDFTIHFLAKYRQELNRHNWNVQETVFVALEETGVSMLYTAIILLCGFMVFLISNFEGTIYLGLLTCITLIVSLLANLVLLPGILLAVKPSSRIQKMQQQVKK